MSIGLEGITGSVSNVIDFKTLASSGNASDFGNLSVARAGCTNTTSSPTRSLWLEDTAPSNQDVIDYVTMQVKETLQILVI